MPHRQSHLGGDDISSPKTKREEAQRVGERSVQRGSNLGRSSHKRVASYLEEGIMCPQMGVVESGGNRDSYKVSSCAHAAITQDMPRTVGTDMGVNRNHWSAKPYWSLLSGRTRGLRYDGARHLRGRGLRVDPYSLRDGLDSKEKRKKRKKSWGASHFGVEVTVSCGRKR
jgi:hypothetical protein